MDAVTIILDSPGEFLAAIPHLLGFYPAESLILVGVAGFPPRPVISVRADLPPADDRLDLAQQLYDSMRRYELGGVLALVVAEGEAAWPPPQQDVADAVAYVFAHGDDLPLLHRLWIATLTADAETPWQCYDDPDCQGTAPAAAETPVAAAVSAAGFVTYASREELAVQITPTDEQALARRGRYIEQLADAAHLNEEPAGREAASRRDLDLVLRAISEIQHGNDSFGDEEIARLTVALGNYDVRDACLVTLTDDRAAAAERLWVLLTRGTPEPERAEPAALLALAAYLRGDGALASVALEVAEAAWPDHRLTGLLTTFVQLGVPPNRLRAVVAQAAAASEHLRPEPTG